MEKQAIAVSVIIPVHNAMPHLTMTVDALFAQTLENVEFIFVENDSTDSTNDYLDTLAKTDGRVTVIHIEPQSCPGPGRNKGAEVAKGEYLYFCDSDDYVYPDALEKMYAAAKESGSDLVFGNIEYTFDEGEVCYPQNRYSADMSREDYFANQFTAVWEKLIKRSLFEANDNFLPLAFEDIIWSYEITAAAEKITFVEDIIYRWHRRKGSVSNAAYSKYYDTIADSEEVLYRQVSSEYRDYVMFLMAKRAKWQLDYRWYIRDIQIASIKKFWPLYAENSYLQEQPKLLKTLEFYQGLPADSIPSTVYIGGFGGVNPAEAEQRLGSTAFRSSCEVVVLSEENCDIEENPLVERAWRNQDYSFVEKYFAAKRVYQDGGVYCDRDMVFTAPIDSIDFVNAFFSFAGLKTFSDRVFGGKAKNHAFAALIALVESEADSIMSSHVGSAGEAETMFSAFIDTVLIEELGIEADGRTHEFGDEAAVYAPEVFLYNFADDSLDRTAKRKYSHCEACSKVYEDGSILLSPEALAYNQELLARKNGVIKSQKAQAKASAKEKATKTNKKKGAAVPKRIRKISTYRALRKVKRKIVG